MAKIEWIDLRLTRWATWRVTGRSSTGGSSQHPMWRGGRQTGYPEAVVPISEEECWKTDQAVRELPEELGLTLVHYYVGGSRRTRQVMAVSPATLSQRIDQAHRLLAQKLSVAPGPDAALGPVAWQGR